MCHITACHTHMWTYSLAPACHTHRWTYSLATVPHAIKVDLQPCSCMPLRWTYSLATVLHAIKVDLQPCSCMTRQTAALRANCCTGKDTGRRSHVPYYCMPHSQLQHATHTGGLALQQLPATNTSGHTATNTGSTKPQWTSKH